MLPILITILVTAPILVLGTWLYLRQRKLSPRMRILLMAVLFLFVLASGPAMLWTWREDGVAREFLSLGRAGLRPVGIVFLSWLFAVCGLGVQLFRLCRWKGEL